MRYAPIILSTMVIATLFFVGGVGQADAAIVGRDVEYSAQGVTLKGFLAYDDKIQGKRPGILVVHEWWGLNDYIRKRARMLAALGYTALAVDMYGQGMQAMHPDDAKKFSSEAVKNFDTSKARFLAAEEVLKTQPTVDPTRIGAIGYCFGGGIVLNMAAEGADLQAVASFHGSLGAVKAPKPGTVKAKIRVYTGEADKMVPPETVEAFKKTMTEAKADFVVLSYPHAMHAFTNPDANKLGKKFKLPIAYNAKADKESWEDLQKFLAEALKK